VTSTDGICKDRMDPLLGIPFPVVRVRCGPRYRASSAPNRCLLPPDISGFSGDFLVILVT